MQQHVPEISHEMVLKVSSPRPQISPQTARTATDASFDVGFIQSRLHVLDIVYYHVIVLVF